MAPTLLNILKKLEEFEQQRKFWLRLSAFIIVVILSITWKWDLIQINHTEWVFGSIGLSMSAVWWYWTMRVVRATISHRKDEVKILAELITDIKDIKTEVSKLKK